MSARILLRQWEDRDLDGFVEMNADPEVMRYFVQPLSRDESIAALERRRREIDERGWGFWAVEVDGDFAGFTGLSPVSAEYPFGPTVEIGWRFRRQYWGKGVAYAAARDAEAFAFRTLGLPELVAFTAAGNLRSRRLMERVGFVRDPHGDFQHPRIPEGHPLRLHFLYRKTWL